MKLNVNTSNVFRFALLVFKICSTKELLNPDNIEDNVKHKNICKEKFKNSIDILFSIK